MDKLNRFGDSQKGGTVGLNSRFSSIGGEAYDTITGLDGYSPVVLLENYVPVLLSLHGRACGEA